MQETFKLELFTNTTFNKIQTHFSNSLKEILISITEILIYERIYLHLLNSSSLISKFFKRTRIEIYIEIKSTMSIEKKKPRKAAITFHYLLLTSDILMLF